MYLGDSIDDVGEPFVERIEFSAAALYPAQRRAIYAPERYGLVEATTKGGKTAGCLVWLMDQAAHGQPGWNYWWVAPVFPVAVVAFRRMIAGMPPGMFGKNESELRVDLPNGTHIFFKSGERPDNLYGEDVHAVVMDEASRMREEAFFAIRTTVTKTRGKIRVIGNVKGRRNWFFKMCRRAQGGERDMAFHKLTWEDAVAGGVLDAAEIEDARRQLPERVFRELYEAEASDDEGNPFGIDAIKLCVIPAQSLYPIAAWGWDLAKHHDWTYGVALDREGREVKTVRFQAPWRETRRRVLEYTAGRPALVDATGVGDPIVEDLQSNPSASFEGFVFTAKTKQMLMENLAVAIQQREIGLTDKVLISELESFEYSYHAGGVRYSAPEGMYDDGVCALALAKKKLGSRSQPFIASSIRRSHEILAADAHPGREFEAMRVRQSWEDRGGLM